MTESTKTYSGGTSGRDVGQELKPLQENEIPAEILERAKAVEAPAEAAPAIRVMTQQDLIPGLEVPPMAKLIWHSPEAQQDWGPLMQRAQGIHDMAEYEMVRLGLRPCATIHIFPYNYDRMMERIQRDRLVWLPIVRTKNYKGFAHRHYPTTPDDPDSSVYGVLARKLEDAERFRRLSEMNVDHEGIGELLGFPPCCAKAFTEWWGAGYVDPLWQAAVNTPTAKGEDRVVEVEGSIYTHQFLRYVGLRITSHLPCSLTCKASHEIGKVWLQVMDNIDGPGTEALVRLLELPLRWSVLHGVAIVETPYFTVVTNSMPTRRRWDVYHATLPAQEDETVRHYHAELRQVRRA